MLLLVGEIYIDYTRPTTDQSCKLRLGGIVHAARGTWASGVNYSVAAACPSYIVEQATSYLMSLGCSQFIWIGEVIGAPNVILIGDATEVSDNKYEELLREEKRVLRREVSPALKHFQNILIFPGRLDLGSLRTLFSDDASFSFDMAYDLHDISVLDDYVGSLRALIISTSSTLFASEGADDVSLILAKIQYLKADVFLLKENRGGSRLFNLHDDTVENIPATLGQTSNSVGVGDVYSAVMLGFSSQGWKEAAWRGANAATCYSQTTYPDDFKNNVQRMQQLTLERLQSLGGTILPWHVRKQYPIYFAAPDFANIERKPLDRAIESLKYHNFNLRRPIIENGELAPNADISKLITTYAMDYELIQECSIVFAVPLKRDPGTLVEIGIAIAMGKPVITYDPYEENYNTMIVAGSTLYSQRLDECLNGVFDALSKINRNMP